MASANVLTVNVKLNADGSMLINGVKKSREEVEAFAKSSSVAKDKVKDFGDSSAVMGSKVTDFGKSVAGLVVSLAAAGGALYKIASDGREFETKISQLAVITGATGNDLDLLKTKAISLGNELGRTGSAFAEAAAVMGSQRPELLKMPAVLAETTAQAVILAKAAGAMGISMSDADAAKHLGGTLNQFGLDASNSARVINVFTASAKEGSALIGDVAESMKQAGGALSNANISVEESAGLIETLAKFNIVGSEAGVATRNFVNLLGSSADKLATLGIAASEVNPQIVGLSGTLKRLEQANLSAADITYLFGMENANAATRLIQNRSEVERFTKAVTGTNAAYDSATQGSQTLESQWKNLTARLTNLSIGIYENFEPALKSSMATINSAVEIFTGLAVELGLVNQSFKTGTERSAEFKNSVQGLVVSAEIVGAGGILWAGFAAAPAIIGGTIPLITSVTTALWGTSVAGVAASGAIGGITVAGGALAAAFAGWKFGSYLWEEFGSVRAAGYWAIGELQKLFIDFKIQLVELSGVFEKIGERFSAAFQNPLSYVKTLFLEFSSYIQQKFSDFVGNLANTSYKVDFLPGMGDATAKLTTFSNELQISAKRMANAVNETDYSKQAKSKDEEINKSVENRISALIQEKNAIGESQIALMEYADAYQKVGTNSALVATALQESSKIGIEQAKMLAEQTLEFGDAAQKATTDALAYAGAVQQVATAQKKTQETNKGASIGEQRKLVETLNIELDTLPYENELDKKLATLRKKFAEDKKLGDAGITKELAAQLLAEAEAKAQINFLTKTGVEIGKERLKVYENGNILQTLKDEFDRVTFLTEAQREYLVAEKASIEAGKLFNEVKNQLSKSGLSEEQARVNDLMRQYGGIISESSAKSIASIEKQAKGYTELRGAYDKLQVASVISEQNELITLSQKYGDSIARQIFDINKLTKARQDSVNAQRDIQTAGLTGVQKDIATTAIKYGGDVEAAKEVVALQRQKSAIEELVAARKELSNSTLTAEQQKYLALSEKIGASAAKESLEMRNLAEACKAGVAELQKATDELKMTGLSEQAKSYFETIKGVAPEYREQILVLKQQTTEIQKQQSFYNDLLNTIADQFALMQTGQKSVSQGWKDMANDVGSMLQNFAADQMKNQIMQAFGANNPQQDAMAAVKAAQQADADRAKQFQVSIQEVDISVKKTIEERSIDVTSKMGATIDDGVKKLQSGLETALSNLNQSMPKAIESFGNQMATAISNAKPAMQSSVVMGGSGGDFGVDLGSLSKKYESGKGGAGTVSTGKGDRGGVSYGTYQLATKTGTAQTFVNSISDTVFGQALANLEVGSKEFSAKWKELAANDETGFAKLQHDFIKKTHYDPLIAAAEKIGVDLTACSKALNDAVWSTGVQHGGGTKIVNQAIQKAGGVNASDADIIKSIYALRSDPNRFKSSSADVQASVMNRFKNEEAEALKMLNNEMSGVSKTTKELATSQTTATVATKAISTAQSEQTQTISQAKTVQKEASLTQAQMLDQQNAAFVESSQSALKAAESVGVLGLNGNEG